MTVTATVGTPSYVDPIPVTFTATVSATNSSATVPTGETVEFYDQTTGNDLGTGTYDTSSQQWTLNTSDVAMDGDTIVAVYSGDGNFAGSQGTATVVGHTLSVDSPVVTYPSGSDDAYTFQGDVVTLSDGVSNLDGAAFTVAIDWGDGGQPETYSFAAPTNAWEPSPFTVAHYYETATGTCSVGVTVTASDGRTASPDPNPTSVNTCNPGPIVTISATSDGNGGWSLTAGAYEPWDQDATFPTFQWNTPDVTSTGNTVAFTQQEWSDLTAQSTLTVTDGNGAATTVSAIDQYGQDAWLEMWPAPPQQPMVTITESDTGQTVQAGQAATFDIHVDWGSTLSSLITVYYETVDGTAKDGIDYQSARGAKSVEIYHNWETGEGDATIRCRLPPGFTAGRTRRFR